MGMGLMAQLIAALQNVKYLGVTGKSCDTMEWVEHGRPAGEGLRSS